MSSASTSKKFVLAFNLLCALLALVLIAFGIYIICSYETNEMGGMAAYAYIGIGAGTLLIYLLGSVGAIRNSVCLTVTFITLLYVVILAQAAVAFLLTKGRDSVASNLSNSLDAAWEEELKSPGAMSLYENWFECCGRASPQDYIVNERLPPSTCFRNHDNSKSENLIETGCRVEFENYWMDLLHIFNILAWVLIALEFISSIVACCLCNSIRNDHRRAYF